MINMHLRWLSIPAVAAAALLQLVAAASATPILDRTRASCTGSNCDSIELTGRLSSEGENNAGPWTIQVYGNGGNECVRLQVLSQGSTDLEMVAISPSGQIYRNDDGGGTCETCPLLKIVSTEAGDLNVSISDRTGRARDSRFRFAYGRYVSGNKNCQNPTDPR